MLRFQPDGWLEGLLRPLILADPVGYVYFELPAPDLRFALLALLVPLALAGRRMRARLPAEAWRTVIALVVMLYLWTFTTGNGRYFMAGLMLAGPLLVLLLQRLPATRSMRASLIVGALALQLFMVQQHFSPGHWAWAFWRQGPGLLLAEAPRLPPSLLITITNQTYSMLVPQFHPDSRWVNLVGQSSLKPGMPEYARFRRALSDGLPTYVVFPAAPGTAAGAQPGVAFAQMLASSLGPHGLRATMEECRLLPAHLTMRAPSGMDASNAPRLAFWMCPVAQHAPPATSLPEPRWGEVFAQVEQRCPRFFPPGRGQQRESIDFVMRDYPATDTRLYVHDSGVVTFRHTRAINATALGGIEEVRRGDFEIACDKLPGRYVYPWQRP